MQHYNVFIQKEQTGAVVKETIADFGVWCASIPFDIGMEVKEPVVRDWKDENGEDAYLGDSLKFAA